MHLREKIADLIEWFEGHKRPFPWRRLEKQSPNFPYFVWISEVMLQQTRAEVVIPYFLVWKNKYPTIQALASAPFEEVMKAWEGLGYYSRARRLWSGAKYLVETNHGRLFENYEELLEIPGFGPYTAGAVASFAFHKKEAAIDGNVARVIARLFSITEPIDKGQVKEQIRSIMLSVLPEEKPWVAMEAFIELGALICMKKPKCHLCPFEKVCLAKAQGTQENLPVKQRKEKIEKLYRDVALIICKEKILVGKVASGKVMADLYEFPYCERGKLGSWLQGPIKIIAQMDTVEHSFTRFRAFLYPHLIHCEEEIPLIGYDWLPIKSLKTLPFSSGHRKLLSRFLCTVN
jgi:A/G-specific adenine glycosylase